MTGFVLSASCGRARTGYFDTPHGRIKTPVFMNVMTAAAIRGGASSEDLEVLGCEVALSNTYHLAIRPGGELIRKAGGLRKFMSWDGPLLTDSGGFQVFSLENLRKIGEEGVTFTSYLDGKRLFLSPETSMETQAALGSTIAMAFDECVKNPCPKETARLGSERTLRWYERSKKRLDELKNSGECINPGQMLFAINQGGIYEDLRRENALRLCEKNADGYAIGGLAVGEEAEKMYEIIDAVEPILPKDRPRYLMGVGTPLNILEAVRRGVDMFDCVLPQRNAARGNVYTKNGRLYLLNAKYRDDFSPIDPDCKCPACRRYSRAYIRHLIKADERLGMRLCILHNLYFMNHFMLRLRREITDGTLESFYLSNRDILDRLL
ncbi:MAG: tRNA guanosine(34) transglycosylase Tgt [Clostridia bacterium]|nr:tRNA guanosine(34) transglycosylase Tgt [Clostridia bacterium]